MAQNKIPLPKGEWQGRVSPKQEWNIAAQTVNPGSPYLPSRVLYVMIWVPIDLGSSVPMALLFAAHMASVLA